jgi:hypothetical protein
MTENNIAPDINHIIGELSLQVANLTRENAVLKATVAAYEKALSAQDSESDK